MEIYQTYWYVRSIYSSAALYLSSEGMTVTLPIAFAAVVL